MKYIQSTKNDKVKQWKKLLTKKERDKSGTFLVEGEHLVEEARKASVIQELIVTESYHPKLPKAKFSGLDLYVIANEVEKVITDTETPQGIYAVCKQIKAPEAKGTRYLLIDAVQDPGNVGTMIRTADAAGLDAVILGEGSVDPYNPKVVRSAQGSHFHIPLIRGNLDQWIDQFHHENIPVYGTALKNAVPMNQVEPKESFAIIVGNEGQGVNESMLSKTTQNLFIPIYGESESLNVSVAAGILMYYLRGS